MELTDYHAKYLAHELTKRCGSDSVEELASVLADAQVDLNPFQVEAALFASRSSFSKGAILADEVGLGKTIEAGLLVTDAGQPLDDAQYRRLFDLPGMVERTCTVPDAIVSTFADTHTRRQRALLEELSTRNGRWFDVEMEKLDRWAEDRRPSLKAELAELDEALKAAKKAARLAPTLPEKLKRQREARVLEGMRDEVWRAFDQASREIDRQKDMLLDEIGERLQQHTESEPIFALRWNLA